MAMETEIELSEGFEDFDIDDEGVAEVIELAEDDFYDDDEAEFLGAALTGLAGVAAPAVKKLLGGSKRRRPLRRVRAGGSGVATARLSTPRGNATLKLPSRVPTLKQFKGLEQAVNRNASRLNTTQKDIGSLRKRVASVVTDVAKDVAKLKKEQKDQSTQSLLFSMMFQQQLQSQLASHHHPDAGGPPVGGSTTPQALGGSSQAMAMMPLMLMGGDGGDDMVMMMMMMTMMQSNQAK